MRIVRWASSERVDLPDLTAMSFLALGEFRRSIRALVTGEAAYIIQGFEVEPESPATTRVMVQFQPPGDDRGEVLGAEQTTAGTDYGQLIGGRDSSFLDEGLAQQFIDLTAEPPGSFVVEMRFVYANGVSDNRAFWNQGTQTEYVGVTETRHVSGWQIQHVAAPTGGQWIPLAVVTWDGVSIDAADIADVRTFLFEGISPFRRATQTSSGGVEDFDRSVDRDVDGTFRIRDVVRALMRQVQDLKGQPNFEGDFDWFSRVFSPFDPGGDLSPQQTKTLRSVDTVSYTVGDGITTFGDFNGVTGVDECLDLIAAMPAALMAARIEVRIHGGTLPYTLSSQKVITPSPGYRTVVCIRAATQHDQTNELEGRPIITIAAADVPDGGYVLQGGAGTSFELDDVQLGLSGSAVNKGLISCETGYVRARRSQLVISGPAVVTDSLFCVITGRAQRSYLENCATWGRLCFFDETVGTTRAERNFGGYIENCSLLASQLTLHHPTAGADTNVAVGFEVRNSLVAGRATAPFAGSKAMIDGGSASYITFRGCTLQWGQSENCIDARTYVSNAPYKWSVIDCEFDGDTVSNGTHTFGAGINSVDGTGWAINVEEGTSITVRGCTMRSITSTDAGGIRLFDVLRYTIESTSWDSCGHTAGGSDLFQGVFLSGTTDGCFFGALNDLSFDSFVTGTTRVRSIDFDRCAQTSMKGCKLYGRNAAFTAITPAASYCAVRIDTTDALQIEGCSFNGWAAGSANSRTILFDGSPTSTQIRGCQFSGCGGFPIVRTSGSPLSVTIDACLLNSSHASEDGFDCSSLLQLTVTNSRWDFSAGSPHVALRTSTSGYVVMGCASAAGNYNRTAGTGRGYSEAGQDLNLFLGYT